MDAALLGDFRGRVDVEVEMMRSWSERCSNVPGLLARMCLAVELDHEVHVALGVGGDAGLCLGRVGLVGRVAVSM